MSYQIFIVEDHPSMQEAYSRIINSQPDMAVCEIVSTAAEALAAIALSLPDLVLTDISLPGISGIELVRQLNVDQPELPVLLLSGHDRRFYGDVGVPNVKGYVMKHEGPEALLIAIRRVLDPYHAGNNKTP